MKGNGGEQYCIQTEYICFFVAGWDIDGNLSHKRGHFFSAFQHRRRGDSSERS